MRRLSHAHRRRPSSEPSSPRLAKGDETRARILDTALSLFIERGYEGTTMRGIAEEAGVAIGNAYYYFESKEHLIQAFYDRTHREHVAVVAPMLGGGGSLRDRILAVMRAKIDTVEPYHGVAGALFRTAADPGSPLNPFSEDSRAVREESTEVFRAVVDGSTTRVPDDLRAELPRLLWIYHMGVILYWIHDKSAGRSKSRRLVELSVDLIAKLVALGSNPLLLPVRRAALRLVRETVGATEVRV